MGDLDKQAKELIGQGLSNVAVGDQIGRSESWVRHARKRFGLPPSTAVSNGGHKNRTVADVPSKGAEVEFQRSTGEGEFRNVRSEGPLTDWDHVFERFGLDPQEFTILDDTVTMKAWDQSALDRNTGERNTVTLYSYGAKFQRRTTDEGVSVDEARRVLREWAPIFFAKHSDVSDEQGLVVALADFQLGKGENGGTAGTLRRLNQSLDNVVERIDALRGQGVNLRTLLLANMGDHTEGTHGSYANQPYTVDMNLRDQLQTALEVNLHWIKTLAPLFEDVEYSAVLCNHGTLSRAGGRENITDDADNATGLISDLLERICGSDAHLNKVRFNIPTSEMITTTTIEGVAIPMAHGQKITGSESNWLAAQSQNLTQRRGFVPDVWLTAHKHHAQVTDFGPYTRIQATTVDPGSKFFEDMTGQYSRTGVTTFTVGTHLPGMWDNYRIC